MMGVTNTYSVLLPMKSLNDEDARLTYRKEFAAAFGDAGTARMNKLSEESVASVGDNLWMVNREWSYVEKSWIDADPQYWAPPEPAAEPAPKRAPKPPPAN